MISDPKSDARSRESNSQIATDLEADSNDGNPKRDRIKRFPQTAGVKFSHLDTVILHDWEISQMGIELLSKWLIGRERSAGKIWAARKGKGAAAPWTLPRWLGSQQRIFGNIWNYARNT
jgi:hypothetical protein